MEEYIELKDKFKIDDNHSNIRGFVVARTEDGKIVFTKENMIVKSGRKLILSILTDNSKTLPNIYPVSGSEYRMTLPEDNVSTSQELYSAFGSGDKTQAIGSTAFVKVDTLNELAPGKYFVDLDNLCIRFKLQKDANVNGGGSVVSSFGLVYASDDVNNETGYELFSRVTFPSYPDSVVLLFDYYIYF